MTDKYNKLPVKRPQINDLVWWLDPQGKELLGYFVGLSYNFPIFIGTDKKTSRFHPKYWRFASIEDETLIDWHPDRKPKRKSK
jgi:hypothetical protein